MTKSQAGGTYPVFQGSLLNGAHPVTLVLLTQPADEADGLRVVLTEEQLHLLHVARALWQGLGAQASRSLLVERSLALLAARQTTSRGLTLP